jgi:hypothetical protein
MGISVLQKVAREKCPLGFAVGKLWNKKPHSGALREIRSSLHFSSQVVRFF